MLGSGESRNCVGEARVLETAFECGGGMVMRQGVRLLLRGLPIRARTEESFDGSTDARGIALPRPDEFAASGTLYGLHIQVLVHIATNAQHRNARRQGLLRRETAAIADH